jgi:hypothetical protein
MHVPMEMLKALAGFRMTAFPCRRRAGGGRAARRPGRRARERPVDSGAADPGRQASCARAPGRTAAQRAVRGAELKQLGYPVRFAQWSALFVPTGTPDDAIRSCAAAVKAAADANVRQVIAKAGSPIEASTPEFQTYWEPMRPR